MFRSSIIIRELALNLAKVILMLKTFDEVTSLFIMRLCGSILPHNPIWVVSPQKKVLVPYVSNMLVRSIGKYNQKNFNL